MDFIIPGSVKPANVFSSVSPVICDVLIFEIINGLPTVSVQKRGSSARVAMGISGDTVYFLYIMGGQQYTVLETALSLQQGSPIAALCYFTLEYRNWLNKNGVYMHKLSPPWITGQSMGPGSASAYSYIYASRHKMTNPINHGVIKLYPYGSPGGNGWMTPTIDLISALATGDRSPQYFISYVNDISWYTPKFVATVKAALGIDAGGNPSINGIPIIAPVAAPVVSPIVTPVVSSPAATTNINWNFMWIFFLLILFVAIAVFTKVYLRPMISGPRRT